MIKYLKLFSNLALLNHFIDSHWVYSIRKRWVADEAELVLEESNRNPLIIPVDFPQQLASFFIQEELKMLGNQECQPQFEEYEEVLAYLVPEGETQASIFWIYYSDSFASSGLFFH